MLLSSCSGVSLACRYIAAIFFFAEGSTTRVNRSVVESISKNVEMPTQSHCYKLSTQKCRWCWWLLVSLLSYMERATRRRRQGVAPSRSIFHDGWRPASTESMLWESASNFKNCPPGMICLSFCLQSIYVFFFQLVVKQNDNQQSGQTFAVYTSLAAKLVLQVWHHPFRCMHGIAHQLAVFTDWDHHQYCCLIYKKVVSY